METGESRVLSAVRHGLQDVNYFVPMPGAKAKGLLGKQQELQLLKVATQELVTCLAACA